MNKRKALERRRALSPQASAVIKRFEAQRAEECGLARRRHDMAASMLRQELQRDLAEIRGRYAKSIEAVNQGDRTGILVASEVPQ